MKLTIEKGTNKYKSLLFVLFMCYEQIIGILRSVVYTDIWSYFTQGIILLLTVMLFFKSSRREILLLLGFTAILLAALFLFPRTSGFSSENGITKSLGITQGFIGFYIAFLCSNNPKLIRDLKTVGVILFVYNFWYVISGRVYATSNFNAAGYNMAFGFSAMAACMITVFFSFAEEKKAIKTAWIVMSIILTIFITLLGSRGPLLGILSIFVLTYLTIYMRNKDVPGVKKAISLFLALSIILFFILLPDVFFETLSSILTSLGFDTSHSRTLERLINGTAITSKSRGIIWAWFLSNLNLFGHGAYSEWFYYGIYAHNFFLDVLFDFGIIFGSIFIIAFIDMVIKTIRLGDKIEAYALFTITFSYFIGRLLLSSTFWWETFFWMLLGVMSRILLDRKMLQNERTTSMNEPKAQLTM